MDRFYDPGSGREIQRGVREPLAAGYQPSDEPMDPYIGFSGPNSVLTVHNPTNSPAPTVSPKSDADIGHLGDCPNNDDDNLGE